MRIALGSFMQETNSFCPVLGSWQHFRQARGQRLIEKHTGTASEVGGALAAAQGNVVVPLLTADAVSAGPVAREVFEALLGELLQRLEDARPFDGVLLVLHGAMVVEGLDDGTGAVLRVVRERIGVSTPLIGTLDIHANVTRQMAEAADALVGYHTAPHVDMYETGYKAMRLLLAACQGQVKPTMALRRLPMILPAENGKTTDGPMSEMIALAEALEREAGILCVSVHPVQPWLDLPDVGCAVTVVTDGDPERADREAERLADEFWRRRADFAVELVPLPEAIERARLAPRGPVIFGEGADAPSSGASGDSTVILRELLDRQIDVPAYLNLVDPPAVAEAVAAGVSNDVELTLGGKLAPKFFQPVRLQGRVRAIGDGRFRHEGPGYKGVEFSMGRAAVIVAGLVHVVVMERPVLQWDPQLYRSLGLEPRNAKIVVVKSPAAFRAAYGPFAAEIIMVDTPGAASANLLSMPWERLGRPIYPLDDLQDWRRPERSSR